MATPVFYLNVNIIGYDAEIVLNGAPIVQASQAYACICYPTISEWVINGSNTLTVVIYAGRELPTPEGEAQTAIVVPAEAGNDTDEAPRLRVALCRGEMGEVPEDGAEEELIVLEWQPPPEDPNNPLVLPVSVSEKGDVAQPWGEWSWQRAEPFAPTQETAIELTQFIQSLHAPLSQKNLLPLMDASKPKFDEVAPCYDMTPADATSRLTTAFKEISAPAQWKLAAFDPTQLQLRPCCDNKVVEPRTATGEPVLRQAAPIDGQSWGLQLFIARVDGKLAVVR
ncbi:MAG: hypothetical protein H6718_20665 [Polyangiaceae bacterium]|nr:hypothetical protein [Myxococcales bacterium]MCB9587829.1 hypothetical protein [Polyangiaceae bacterium]MCB9608778.1 hypothetical protein [Polyangiaceae bacterium]